jgi:WD40 repeat protein
MEHPAAVESLAIWNDGRLAVTGCSDNILRLWNLDTGELIREFAGHTNPANNYLSIESVQFSPDGQFILSASVDGTARLWDVNTGETVRIFQHGGSVLFAAISPDGKYVLTGGSDRTARLWDLATGNRVRTLVGHTDTIYAVAFSRDGRKIVTASADSTARIWDTNIQDTIDYACTLIYQDWPEELLRNFNIDPANPVCP